MAQLPSMFSIASFKLIPHDNLGLTLWVMSSITLEEIGRI